MENKIVLGNVFFFFFFHSLYLVLSLPKRLERETEWEVFPLSNT